ncbi:hypothetical protein ABZS71_30455 [Streptomyces sp. NPDC005393]|uniref:hypothetical protein n=1 Tax=Streptomyces sp. NPDC005393 TaxID=3157041 RepID=UPI0033A935DE
MKNVKKIAVVAVATCGILFAGAAGASATPGDNGDDIPVISNFNQLDWEDSPFCGTQIKTENSEQESSCPVAHLENSPNSTVVIIND